MSDFIYWLNCNILSLWDGAIIAQKSLFLHTFSWDWSLVFVLKEWSQLIHCFSKLILDLKNATCVDTLKIAKKVDLANFKSNADELDLDKLKNVPSNLSNLKSNAK